MTRRLFWQLWGFYMIRISTCWPGPCLRFVFPGLYTLSSWGAHTLLLLLKLSIKQYQELQTLNGKPIAGKNVSFHLLPHMSRPCRRLRQGNWSKGYKTGCVYTKWARTQNFSWFSGSRARGAWGKRSSIKKEREVEKTMVGRKERKRVGEVQLTIFCERWLRTTTTCKRNMLLCARQYKRNPINRTTVQLKSQPVLV